MPFSGEQRGFDEQGRRIRRIAEGINNANSLLSLLAFDLAKMWQDNIDAGPNDRWEAGASYRVRAFGGVTLRDRGLMKLSIAGAVTAPNEATIGSAMTVGDAGWNLLATHEFGANVIARNAPYLSFRVPVGTRIFSNKTGKQLARPVSEFAWARKKQVRIPRRPTSPYNWDTGQLMPAADQLVRSRVGDYIVELAI